MQPRPSAPQASGRRRNESRDLAQAVGGALETVANQRLAAAPPHLMPAWLTAKERRFRLEDGTAILDRLMMEKMPREIDAMRRAAKLADEGYALFRGKRRGRGASNMRSWPTLSSFSAPRDRPRD